MTYSKKVKSDLNEQSSPSPTGVSHYRTIDSIRTHAVTWRPTRSPATAAQPVLLIHGLGANTLSWQPVGQSLADALDREVTAVDLIGFGRTRAPDRRATVAANQNFVIKVLEEMGPAVVMGNSMGGVISAGVTARRPDLVEALVLVDPALPWPRLGAKDWKRGVRFAPVLVPPIGRFTISTRARILGPERLVDLSLSWSLHDQTRIDPDLRTRLINLAAERFAYPEASAAYVDAAGSLLQTLNQETDNDLGVASAARPTLLIHGDRDRLVDVKLAHEATTRHSGIDLEILTEIGHAPQLEAPEQFLKIVVDWLNTRVSDNAVIG